MYLLLSMLALLASAQQYALQQSLSGQSFLDGFEFYDSWDPTFGYVHYIDQATAWADGMLNVTASTVAWGVETHQVLEPNANLGRLSLRLQSKRSWTHGLFILDLIHMPANQCGVWPAFWTLGSGIWPANGEIDIIEYTNNLPNDLMALHTSPGCSIAGSGQTGILLTNDCDVAQSYTGCGVSSTKPNSEGVAFDVNTNGGGVYIMEWTSTAIQIWFFQRDQIPAAVRGVNMMEISIIDIKSLGLPMANFQGACDIDAHFFNHTLIFTTDFCGSYAGPTWQEDGCPMLNATNGWQSCNDYVALNPQAFVDAYWEVNYLNVYQTIPGGGLAPSASSLLSSVTPVASSTASAINTVLSNAQGRSNTPAGTPLTSVPPLSTVSPVESPILSLATTHGTATSTPSASPSILSSPVPVTPSTMMMSSTSSASPPFCTSGTCHEVVTVIQTITVPAALPLPGKDRRAIQVVSDEEIDTICRKSALLPGESSPSFSRPSSLALESRSARTERDLLTRASVPPTEEFGTLYRGECLGFPCEVVPAPLTLPVPHSPRAEHAIHQAFYPPGGTMGFCSVPGSSCNEHHVHHEGGAGKPHEHKDLCPGGEDVDITQDGAKCAERKVGHDEESSQGKSTSEAPLAHEATTTETSLCIVTAIVTATVTETATEMVTETAIFPCDPKDSDWATVPILGPREMKTVYESTAIVVSTETLLPSQATYSHTTFAYQPHTSHSVSLISSTPAAIRETPTSLSVLPSTVVDLRTKIDDPLLATCTPVAILGSNAKPTRVGCLGPQALNQGQSIAVADKTITIEGHFTYRPPLGIGDLHSVDTGNERQEISQASAAYASIIFLLLVVMSLVGFLIMT